METVDTIPRLPVRQEDSHKGIFGKILIVGGSRSMCGAPALAGMAALKSGSGLVRVAVGRTIQPVVAGYEPCYTTIGLDDNDGDLAYTAVNTLLSQLGDNDALGFGPGIGISGCISGILEKLIRQDNVKIVIDADGLNNLTRMNEWYMFTKANVILTPHPGEMKRLWNSLFRDKMPDDRKKTAMEFANKTGSLVVLKGHATVVTDGNRLYINPTGNPGMATAGSGDVLTGIITSLLGQGLEGFDAAVLGVYIHGLSGDKAARQKGPVSLIATDILDFLPEAFVSYEREIL